MMGPRHLRQGPGCFLSRRSLTRKYNSMNAGIARSRMLSGLFSLSIRRRSSRFRRLLLGGEKVLRIALCQEAGSQSGRSLAGLNAVEDKEFPRSPA
jgi:hypothetical protein